MNSKAANKRSARSGNIESLESSLNYLMSRFAITPSVWIAHAVISHLDMLLAMPEAAGLSAERRSTYHQLVPAWQGITRRLLATQHGY